MPAVPRHSAPPMDDTALLDAMRTLLDEAERVVVFTGAGISTESGIPDFRSPGTGIWNKVKPIEFQDFMASEEVRRESWRRRFSGDRSMEGARPNKGHKAVAKLVAEGKVTAVITQNVDNLFQDAGIPDEQVVELHGNASYAKCLSCGTRYETGGPRGAVQKPRARRAVQPLRRQSSRARRSRSARPCRRTPCCGRSASPSPVT